MTTQELEREEYLAGCIIELNAEQVALNKRAIALRDADGEADRNRLGRLEVDLQLEHDILYWRRHGCRGPQPADSRARAL
jgi:hypothetical protein